MIIMAKSRRGGYRKPGKPSAAPATGPGAGAGKNRTDGGPASATQPIRRIPDVPYGEQSQLTAQQQMAPLGGSPDAGVMAQGQPAPRPDIFAPTEMPNLPLTDGAATGPGATPPDMLEDEIDIILAALHSVNPHPVIAELINTRSI